MSDTDWQSDGVSRRQFLGGVSGLLAAAAYSKAVPETVAAQRTEATIPPSRT